MLFPLTKVKKKKKKKDEDSDDDAMVVDDTPPPPPRKVVGRSRKPVSYAIKSDDESDSD